MIGLAGNSAFNKVILVIAIAFGTINIVGGFLVTDRMLEMFKRKPAPPPKDDGEVTLATVFLQNANFLHVLYIVAFALFIYGLSGLTGPRTAVRGNRIAAVGMAIAVIATLLARGEGNWALIVIGVAIGAAVGVPAARRVKMTAMPQMVALFNGVGGGAVFLIAWAEFRNTGGYRGDADLLRGLLAVRRDHRLGLLLGLEHRLRQAAGAAARAARSRSGARSSSSTALIAAAAVGLGVAIVAGSHSQLLFILMLLAAAVLGNLVVLPIGGADMPVVISLLNAFTGLSAAATGVALNNPALIVAGMIVGASGSILTNLMAVAMNRSIPAIIAGGFGGGGVVEGATGAGEHAGTRALDERRRRRDPARLRAPGRDRPRLRHGGRAGPARRARARQGARGARRRGQVRDPSRRRADARPHERAARRGRRALRAAARRWTTSTPSSRAPTSRS